MAISKQDISFSANDVDIGKVFGVDLSDFKNTLFSKEYVGSGEYASLAANFDYTYDVKVGLDLELSSPSLGEFDLTYPLFAGLELPDEITAGAAYLVGTTNDFFVEGAVLAAESLNFGGLELSAKLQAAASLTNIEVGNLIETPLFTLADIAVATKDPVSVPLVTIDSLSGGRELIDGLDLEFATPSGEEKNTLQDGTGPTGVLIPLTLPIEEPLVSLELNPIEFLDIIPALAALDFLTEEYKVAIGDYNFELEYTIVAPEIVGGYGLVQTFSFAPSNILTKIQIGTETYSGKIGDDFTFIAPTDLSKPLTGEITYELVGNVDVSYSLAPIGKVGVEILSGEVSLDGPVLSPDITFGPLANFDYSWSLTDGRYDLYKTSIPISVDMIAPVVQKFEIPVGKGQDIAFVIDTTGSMSDDIDAVRAQSEAILDTIFDTDRGFSNSRVAVVGYNDPETETILSFTEHATLGERKAAAIDAINSISVGGGGDYPEAVNAGLLRALNGGAGEWREDAAARRIVLFGDAPPNDPELEGQVRALAADLGVKLSGGIVSKAIAPSVYMSTFAMAAVAGGTSIPVQIFTVVIGSDPDVVDYFGDLSTSTGGVSFSASDAAEAAGALIKVLETPIYSLSVDTSSVVEGNAGTQSVVFTISRDSAASAAVVALQSIGSADSTDVSGLVSSLAFAVGEKVKTVTLTINGDVTFESDELVGLQISGIDEAATIAVGSAQVIIVNDDPDKPAPTEGPDRLEGSSGDDVISGLGGADIIKGLGGNDTLWGDTGQDRILGGDGNDVLYGGADIDRLFGGLGDDWIDGGADNDVLLGDDGNDRLYGAAGNDTLTGGLGNDVLSGGQGNDRLVGGEGGDKLFGGAGADTFAFSSVKDSYGTGVMRDSIFDFSLIERDRIDLSAIDANTKAAGNQAFSYIGKAGFHGKAGELRYEKLKSDTIVYADTNGDKKADFVLHFDDPLNLQKGFFVL